MGTRSAVIRWCWLRFRSRMVGLAGCPHLVEAWLQRAAFSFFLCAIYFLVRQSEKYHVCRREQTHKHNKQHFGPNDLGARRARQAPGLQEGRSGPGRIRASLGFIAVLEQSTGGCLNWGNREVIKRGAAEERKCWFGCCLEGGRSVLRKNNKPVQRYAE